ncbi:hypothetical protein K7432_004303 [Basidiobolus ranarum]|uniref:BZIP domain-containing protein n=1 Tax=Basidiobolus ranarum TaxID=34480 RepID=A0ABR2WYC6_9FUNG
MSDYSPFNFLTPLDFNLGGISDSGSQVMKEELNLWSTAQFTYDSALKPNDNHMVSSTFDPYIVNMHTSPLNTPALSQSGISPDLTYYAENTEFTGLMSPHPAFPLSSVTPHQIHGHPNFHLPSNSPSFEEQPNSISSNKRKNSSKENGVDGKPGSESNLEEDKRRRNTAASARFRVKKKMREQVLETTVQEMTTKAEAMEAKVKELEKEVEWLRELLLEKNSTSV